MERQQEHLPRAKNEWQRPAPSSPGGKCHGFLPSSLFSVKQNTNLGVTVSEDDASMVPVQLQLRARVKVQQTAPKKEKYRRINADSGASSLPLSPGGGVQIPLPPFATHMESWESS